MKKFSLFLFVVFFTNILVLSAVPPIIKYVSSTGGGVKDGSSWVDAYDNTQLQTAIDNCPSGGQVWVAAGTYIPTGWPNGGFLEHDKHFSMRDGVAIYGGLVGNESSDYDMNNRNITGNETKLSGDVGVAGDITDNCFHIINHNGYIYPSLTNSAVLDGFTICDAYSYSQGAALSNYYSSPTFRNCNFTDNYNFNSGGAVYIRDADGLVFYKCTFANNTGYHGGSVYNYSGTSSYEDCIFKNNTAQVGAGFHNENGNSTFLNCIFVNNTVSGGYGWGGGFFSSNSSTPILTNCTIAGNTASSRGGGICSYSGIITLNNCIVWGNSATDGGNEFALLSFGGFTLNNCDYSNESNYAYNGNITEANCINSDPLFVGGTDYSLQSGSPCIDVGNNSYNTSSKDLANHTRIQNSTIDIGAYEFLNLSNAVTSVKLLINRGVRSYNGSCATTNGICSIEIVPTNASNGNADLVVEAEARYENGRLNITVTSDNFDAALYNGKHRAAIRFITNTTLDASIAASFGLSELTLAKGTYSFGGESGIRTSIKLVQNR